MSEIAFWLLTVVVICVYFGYPFLLVILRKLRRVQLVRKVDVTPGVSLIIPAYNEEGMIAQKMNNSLGLDYPAQNLEIIVVSDGSTDRTNEAVCPFCRHGVHLVILNSNQGKSSAQNRGVAAAEGDVLVLTDANVMLGREAVSKLVANLADDSVGCVVGKVRYLNQADSSVSEGEGLYWRYELFLREKESEVGNFAMASGPIMAIRRNLFQPLDPHVGEDFVLPMQTVMAGYRVVYEPEALSEEVLFQNAPSSMFKSKVRVITKDLRGLFLCRAILNPLRYPLYAWGLISHKLLRWLVPYFLVAVFALNLLLVAHPVYRLTLGLQLAGYAAAGFGYLWQRTGRKPPRILGIPFSFCLVNAAALVGVARFVMGKKSGRWEPVREPVQ